MKVFSLIAVRNEERYLPGFLHHMRDAVDGIIALDDCSTDRTREILSSEPRVVSILTEDRSGPPHANETRNRHRLLVEAARLGAQWVIGADADERFEARFLGRLRAEAEEGERTGKLIRCVRIVDLWNSPQHFRIDGRCGPRWTPRMFKLPPRLSERPPILHRAWYPGELEPAPKALANAYLFHLRMINRSDRQARFEKFRLVDPQNTHQAIGYGHLIDETNLTLRPVLPWRAYVDLPRPDLPSDTACRLSSGPYRIRRDILPMPVPGRSACGRARPLRERLGALQAAWPGRGPPVAAARAVVWAGF